MKKIILFLILLTGVFHGIAERRAYLELKGVQRNLQSSKLRISIDFGLQEWIKDGNYIVKENGVPTNFYSLLDAANYLGIYGWKLDNIYIHSFRNNEIYHWIFYKDITTEEEIKAGFIETGILKDNRPYSIEATFKKRPINSNEWEIIKVEIKENITEEELEKIIEDWEEQSSDYYIYEVDVKNKK